VNSGAAPPEDARFDFSQSVDSEAWEADLHVCIETENLAGHFDCEPTNIASIDLVVIEISVSDALGERDTAKTAGLHLGLDRRNE